MKPDLARMLSKIPLLGGTGRALRKPDPERLEDLPWHEFEQLVLEGFVARGYHAAEGPRAVVGGDLLMRRERSTYLVHCKTWQDAKVELDVLHALHRSMLMRGAQGGFVLTFGRFARDAAGFASAERIQLLDGPALKALIEPPRAARLKGPRISDEPPTTPMTRAVPQSPACPLCGKSMRLRQAKRGAHVGRGFWSCINHPDCKGLLPLV